MSMLLIDSGNSALKCRLMQQGKIFDQIFETYEDKSLSGFSHYLGTLKPGKIILASVADEKITQKIKDISFQRVNLAVTQLTSLPELGGLKNGYENYNQLGVDRWLTLLAAYVQLKTDVFIIDCGSAITIDLLSVTRGHLGGAILPGFNTSTEHFKQLFPTVDFNHPDILKTAVPGQTTAQCIHLNEIPATIQQINKLLSDWQNLLEKPVSILLCGQDSGLVGQHLGLDYQIIPDLVFTGMLKQIQLLG